MSRIEKRIRKVLSDSLLDNIPKMVDTFVDINKRFHDVIM